MSIPPIKQEFIEQKGEAQPQTGVLQDRVVSSSSSTSLSASHQKFFEKLRKAQIVMPFVQTVSRNEHFNSPQQQVLVDAFKLCKELPNGNESQTLAEVNHHFGKISSAYQLLIQKKDHEEDFAFHPWDHLDLKYRLAQAYAHRGAPDTAIEFLDMNISDLAKSWHQRYEDVWNKTVSLRASIVSGPNPPETVHEMDIPSAKMKIKFLVDSGDEYQKMEQTGLAALNYEMALQEHNRMRVERAKVRLPALGGIDPSKRNSIRQFLIDYYLEAAPLIMTVEPPAAIEMYHKLLKLDPKPEVFQFLVGFYNKQKANARDTMSRIDLLKKIIGLISSYGDQKAKEELPKIQTELFHLYRERGKECLNKGHLNKAIKFLKRAMLKVEKDHCLVDQSTLEGLKGELFKAFVAESLQLENQGFGQEALTQLKEALEFQRVHLLPVDSAEMETHLKRCHELSTRHYLA